MVQFYTVVGNNNMVKKSMVTFDPIYLIGPGERLLPDTPPEKNELTTLERPVREKFVLLEPVPLNATKIQYVIINDEILLAARTRVEEQTSGSEIINSNL